MDFDKNLIQYLYTWYTCLKIICLFISVVYQNKSKEVYKKRVKKLPMMILVNQHLQHLGYSEPQVGFLQYSLET